MTVQEVIDALSKFTNRQAELKFTHKSPICIESFNINSVEKINGSHYLVHKVNNEFFNMTEEDEWYLKEGYRDED